MYKMSINTQRLHLNTNDAENVEGNHANSIFNLAKANINCLSGQELSISLIKAVLPITMDAFGYMDDTVAFTMTITDSTFTPKILKCFITADDLDIPQYATTTPDVFKFPITYLDSPLSIQDTLNKILATQYAGSPAVQFIIRKDSKRTAVQFDSATATELRFDNSYAVSGRSNYNLPAQRLFTTLGINTFNSPELSSDVPPETIFKGGNGGIDTGTNVFYEYQLSVYHPPLNLVSNLSLDSASSNRGGARNNILAGIQIDVEDQSRVMECTHIGGDVPPEPNPIFFGVPHGHQASGGFPSDPTISYFIYYDGTVNKVYKHDSTSNTTTIHDIGSGANQFFSGIPTNLPVRVMFFEGSYVYFRWDNPSGGTLQIRFTSPTSAGVNFGSTGSTTIHSGDTANQSKTISIRPPSGVNNELIGYTLPNFGVLWSYATGSWGGNNTPFNGLPQTGMNSLLTIQNNNDSLYLFYDTGIVYTINITTQAVVSSAPYGSVASVSSGASVTGSTIVVSKSSSLINHINHSVSDSHKIISATSVSTLNLILESSDGLTKFSDNNIYYEIEIKTYNSQ
jgi:hypothetical protein